ncbi:MAG TPA: class I SAM-dependent methyltransferase [Puia sp.]|jgi:predicted O-methyltransferase YrrM|nr:class I SAM-dependent methyltransferase [Puia sp.]
MYSKSLLTFKWIQYAVLSSNAKGHGIHSPFVYEMVSAVLNDNRYYYAYEKIERVKKNLLLDKRTLIVNDFGAGSSQNVNGIKKISEIAGKEVCTQKFGRLLFRLANYYQARTIFEMGSSLGISTAYMASAGNLSRVISIEGATSIAEIANETFSQLELKNIKLVTGNFDEKLENLIVENPPAELVFIDGNHRKKPVLEYFEKFLDKISPASLIIIHDIHWSREMEEAWAIIQHHPKVKMSIDIFSAGLVFFRNEFQVKQQFIIRF